MTPVRPVAICFPPGIAAVVTLDGAAPAYPTGFKFTAGASEATLWQARFSALFAQTNAGIPNNTRYNLHIDAPGYLHYDDVLDLPNTRPDANPANWDVCIGLDVPPAPNRKFLKAMTPSVAPFKPAPRDWRANMCGVRVPGLPAIYGGNASIPDLVLSWFYDRYLVPEHRAKIRADWKRKGLTHVLLSWPDSRVVGFTPQQFAETCRELVNDGFYICPWLMSKTHDGGRLLSDILRDLDPVLDVLIASNTLSMACIGGELSLWLSPSEVQKAIDHIAPKLTPQGTRVYVHFQQGYFAFQENGQSTVDFWRKQVGKLEGVLYQRLLNETMQDFDGRIFDCLERFAGNYGFPTDCGVGHPFDFIAHELSAELQFSGDMGEAEGDTWGARALAAPSVTGPTGVTVRVMGYGNGGPR